MDDIELTITLPTKLLELLEEKNFTQFAQLLDNKDDPFDVNHFYDDPYFGTLLDIACRSIGNYEFVKKLLEHGAEINRVNEKTGLAPIHEAVQKSDIDTLNVLLADEKCNVRILDTEFYPPVLRAALAGRRDTLSVLLKNKKATLAAEDVLRITDFYSSNLNNRKSSSTDECNDLHHNVVCNLEQHRHPIPPRSSNEWENEEDESATLTCTDDDISHTSSPQIVLLHSLKNQEFDKFHDIFAQFEDTVDVNHFYTSENGTLLDIACRTKNNSEYIEFLKGKKAWINFRNPTRHGRSPLHTAVEYADEQTLNILFGYENCDVNITDDYGNTPLHIAAKLDKPRAVKSLLAQKVIQINATNHKHESALYLALKRNHLEIIRQLLKCLEIQLDTGHDPEDLTCQQIITKRYPRCGQESLRNIRNPRIAELFSLLYQHRTEPFIEQADSNVAILSTADDGFYTYLQYACERGFSDVVDKLLKLGVDPNQTCPNNRSTPIMISAAKGYYKIVTRLLMTPKIYLKSTNANKETVLISLVRGMLASQATNEPKDPERNYDICLEYIMPRISEIVNYSDRDGNTALYYAAEANDRKIVLILLNAGSYICHRNYNEDVVLQSINPVIFEEYLDGLISTNGESIQQSDCQIILNGEIFKPPFDHPEIPETALILLLNKVPKSRHLLQHPVLASFMDLKWYTLKKFYYLHLFLRVLYLLSLSLYTRILLDSTTSPNYSPPSECVFLQNLCPISQNKPYVLYRGSSNDFFNQNTSINGYKGSSIDPNFCDKSFNNITLVPNSKVCCSFKKSPDNSTTSPPSRYLSTVTLVQISHNMICLFCQQSSDEICQQNITFSSNPFNDDIASGLRWLTMIFFWIFVIKEVLQISASPRRYLCSLDNWIGLIIAGTTIYLLYVHKHQKHNAGINNLRTHQLAAVAIFMSYLKLFFLIGKHPGLSTNTEIFKTVSVNFIKFLGCFFCLILAFILSFHILCKYNEKDGHQKEDSIATYNEIGGSIIRTFMMMAGDFDAKCILNGDQLIVSPVLFVLFLLLVTIVLQNLLNGMAVDDIQKIRKDAQLLGTVSQIRYTWYIANAMALDFSYLLPSYNRYCRRYREIGGRLSLNNYSFFRKVANLFPDTLPDCKIRILPNKNNAVMFLDPCNSHSLKYSNWKINPDIVESAAKILQKGKRKEKKKLDFKMNPKLE